MRIALAVVLCLLLVACGSTPAPEPRIEIQRVNVPVSVPCPAIVEAAKAYPDTEEALRAAGPEREGLYNRVRLLMAGRLLRTVRIEELEAALKVCGVSIPPSP